MIEGVTSKGFAFSVNENAADNMELVDALAEATGEEDPLAVSRVCVLLLGKELRKKLYDYLRTEDGRVPIADVSAAIMEIMAAYGQKGKN